MPADRHRRKRCSCNLAQEVFGSEIADVLSIEPVELVEVEDRPTETDVFETEFSDELGEGELIPFVRHRPAHQRQVVEQGLGQDAGLAVVVEADRILALRDLRGVRVSQQR